jgi:hypothetical protein
MVSGQVPPSGRNFHFCTSLEFIPSFIAVPTSIAARSVKGHLACQLLANSVSTAGRDLSTPRLQILFWEVIFMARRLLVLLGFFFLFSISASAQYEIDVFGGYSFQELDRLRQAMPGRNLSGVKIAVQYKFEDWLGIVGEVDGHFGLPSTPAARSLNILAGPHLSIPARISPFVHVLAGLGHGYTNGIWDNSFAAAIGGGIDMRVAPMLSWRILEGDDVLTKYFGGIEHNPRISTGIVLRF